VILSSLTDFLATERKAGKHDDIDIPFVNQKRRLALQAIDYYPEVLEDFARRVDTAEPPSTDPSLDIEMSDSEDSSRWEWDFFLLLEEHKTKRKTGNKVQLPCIWVHVPNNAAQYLLKVDAQE